MNKQYAAILIVASLAAGTGSAYAQADQFDTNITKCSLRGSDIYSH